MLAGTGEGYGNVKVRGNNLAGKPYLRPGWYPAIIAGRSGGTHRSLQQLCQLFQLLEAFSTANASTSADYYLSILSFIPSTFSATFSSTLVLIAEGLEPASMVITSPFLDWSRSRGDIALALTVAIWG